MPERPSTDQSYMDWLSKRREKTRMDLFWQAIMIQICADALINISGGDLYVYFGK